MLRVRGHDAAPIDGADLKRLFAGQRITAARRARLAHLPRIEAFLEEQLAGVAVYERHERDVRVVEFAVPEQSRVDPTAVANAIIDAIELACIAAGGRRIVLLPHTEGASIAFRRRGYRTVTEGCAGGWLEKTLGVA